MAISTCHWGLRVVSGFLAILMGSIMEVNADTVIATWDRPVDVPVSAASYTATGDTVNLSLSCLPSAASLTVVENSGIGFIQGEFDNLAHGQAVTLSYNAVDYDFVANYYGGTGNDLVLVWEGASPFANGDNRFGQLGDGTTTQRNVPVPVDATGVLAGRTVLSVAAGATHSLALCSDGTVAAWGFNAFGQLGDGTTGHRLSPVAVDQSGVLAGRTVVAVSAGYYFSLALCADGSVAAWGFNFDGELGNGTTVGSNVPVLVDQSGVLAGKTVVAVSAGDSHALALCADGTVAAWGYNANGQLGDNSTADRLSPVAVDTSDGVSALFGKLVASISAGGGHSLALCANGTVAAWGANESGQLGDGTVVQRNAAVAVSRAEGVSALDGRSVTSVAAGGSHSLALGADGMVAAWGFNGYGQLGDGSTSDSAVPVEVNSAVSALSSRLPIMIAAGLQHSVAWCTDGTTISWGLNNSGQLGDGTTSHRAAAVEVDGTAFPGGERPVLAFTGLSSEHTLGVVAAYPVPAPELVVEFPAGNVIPAGSGTLNLGTILVGEESTGTVTVRNAGLAALDALTMTIDGTQGEDFELNADPVTPVTPGDTTSFEITCTPGADGIRSATLHLASNDPLIPDYAVNLVAIGTLTETLEAIWNAPDEVPIISDGYLATGRAINFTLNCEPLANELVVVRNTGVEFIEGRFANLEHGQTVVLSHGGQNYDLIANYYGGTGNDLVLVWAGTRVFSWGNNDTGQLGDPIWTQRSQPGSVKGVSGEGVLAGKTVLSVAAGGSHSLALCADGTLAAWGQNDRGQLGNGDIRTTSTLPMPVNAGEGSALHGKVVVAIAAGGLHSMALCEDGTVASWGKDLFDLYNSKSISIPEEVDAGSHSALYGRTVVAIAAGDSHCLALCSDGTLVSWSSTVASRPFAVDMGPGSVLHGRRVVAIAAGGLHSMVLCSDGTVAVWGSNDVGQLGDGTTMSRASPVAVDAGSGSALQGRTVVSVSAGWKHSVALCADGGVVAWGDNSSGQLGDGSKTDRTSPVDVGTEAGSGLEGRVVVEVAAGGHHSLALCADGTLAAWGLNTRGQVGDTTTVEWLQPVVVDQGRLEGGERFVGLAGGGSHNLGLVSFPGNPASSQAELVKLMLSEGALEPLFDPGTTAYTCPVAPGSPSIRVTPTAAGLGLVEVNGVRVASGATSEPIGLVEGTNEITVDVTAHDGTGQRRYTVTVELPADDGGLAIAWDHPADVPVTASAYVASGRTVNFSLNCEPSSNELMVVRNTGPAFIEGEFTNLAHGETVVLGYGGRNYTFVANYHGGSGNDLVLVWAGTRVFSWGSNHEGQLGDGTENDRASPGEVADELGGGALAGKTVVAVATGINHSLALCSDGTLASWGHNNSAYLGQLGIPWASDRPLPLAVDAREGSALHGRRVMAIAVGDQHNLALCSDGALVAWGYNNRGQVGDGSTVVRSAPVLVDAGAGSALYGKRVVAIAAGSSHSLALCSDGTVASWGSNEFGQLGDGIAFYSYNRTLPGAVNTTAGESALAGRKVVAIAAGGAHSLALCADGSAVAWGHNDSGQVGEGSRTSCARAIEVEAGAGSALRGRTVVAIAARGSYNLALCADGGVVAWGRNDQGQLGDGSLIDRPLAVDVHASEGSALQGKKVVSTKAGGNYGMALCEDATVVAWGGNEYGQLGDGTTEQRLLPVAVDASGLPVGSRFTGLGGGVRHSLGLVATPEDPRLSRAELVNLVISEGALEPLFDPATVDYSCTVAPGTESIGMTPVGAGLGSVHINGIALPSGAASSPVPLVEGSNVITVEVASRDGTTQRSYTLTVTRPPDNGVLEVVWDAPSDIPVTTSAFTAAGKTVNFTLNCEPLANELVVVRNTGAGVIGGYFANLAHGEEVVLEHGGKSHSFVANYYGGSGNDLVLTWEGTRVFAWGDNGAGQLGDGTTTHRSEPGEVAAGLGEGLLLGRTVVAAEVGGNHVLALCADGTLAAWGSGSLLGNGEGSGCFACPVAVDVGEGSALKEKRVVAVSAGGSHSLALCMDGTVAAWGPNGYGEVGDGTRTVRLSPVAVDVGEESALSGRVVVAVAAGASHSLALCSDGTMASWGRNDYGQLGHGSSTSREVLPVVVEAGKGSALHGRMVVAIAAGGSHSLALCSDGTVAAWGRTFYDPQSSDWTYTSIPEAVHAGPGSALHGRMVVAIAAGDTHNVALCSDGKVVAWGRNSNGELGDGTSDPQLVPVLVDITGGSALATRTALAVAAGGSSSMASCMDGTLAAWGGNIGGKLGDGTSQSRAVPTSVLQTALSPDERFTMVRAGDSASLALVAPTVKPPVPSCAPEAVSNLTKTSVQLNGTANANDFTTRVVFEYGTDGLSFPESVVASEGLLGGAIDTAVSATVSGLTKGTPYYYRLMATNQGGTTISEVASFITRTEPTATLGTATALNTTSAEVSGSANALGSNTEVYIDVYDDPGIDSSSLVRTVRAEPFVASGYGDTPIGATLTTLLQGTTYYYRIRAESVAGTGMSQVGSFELATLSGLSQVFPAAPPEANGFLFLTMQPPGVGAWRFVGEQQWRTFGVPVGGLATGDREVEFRPVPGYLQPPRETVNVTSGAPATVLERIYYETSSTGTGGLTVTLKPDALADAGVPEATRAQWRLLGETQWQDSDTTRNDLHTGTYLVECKPVTGRTVPLAAAVQVEDGQTAAITVTYRLEDPPVGTAPTLVPFEVVSADTTKPYGFVGQLRSEVGAGSGFLVKARVVATAGHVVFDDGTLSVVQSLQWLHQRHRGTFEPEPKVPRGVYLFDGYAAARQEPGVVPGEGTPESQNLDAAALYFLEDVGRGGSSGFLASDLDENEFLTSSVDKILAGYPVDGVSSSNLGRMHATAPMDTPFARSYLRTFSTTDLGGFGGMSGGPLCVQENGGLYYPAAIYLGGSGQTVVRAIDSEVIDLFDRAEVSGSGGDNNVGGGITHTEVTGLLDATQPGALTVLIEPPGARTAGAGWRLRPETTWRISGNQKGSLTPGRYVLELTSLPGYDPPVSPEVTISGGQLITVVFSYAGALTEIEEWRVVHFGTTDNTGNAADDADPDGDGDPNSYEFVAGTDPNDANDYLRTQSMSLVGAVFTMTTEGKAGRIYELQLAADLQGGVWTTRATEGPLAGDGEVVLTDGSAPGATGIYRIRVTRL